MRIFANKDISFYAFDSLQIKQEDQVMNTAKSYWLYELDRDGCTLECIYALRLLLYSSLKNLMNFDGSEF